jgi:polar amino acid transport system substrate-binding protein
MPLARIVTSLLASLVLSSCIFGPDTTQSTPTPTPNPTSTASAGPTRPRLELSTYQYALQTRNKIRVGVRDNAAPYSSRSGSSYAGFEPDIAREIARAIWGSIDDPNTHIEWISIDDTTLISALTSNQADIVVAGLMVNDANKKVIDLSDAYYKDGQRLLVKKTNDQIKELADVADGEETVTVVKSTPWEDNIGRITNDRAKLLPLDTLDFCMQALASGAADAFTQDEAALIGLTIKDATVKIVGKQFTDDQLGIGIKQNVSADRQGFREFLNNALLKIVADRTWAKLYETYVTPVTGEKKQLPTD